MLIQMDVRTLENDKQVTHSMRIDVPEGTLIRGINIYNIDKNHELIYTDMFTNEEN